MSFNILNQPNYELASEINNIAGANIQEQIKNLLASDKIVLLMKGSAQAPQCGFSANVAAILLSHNVNFKTFNILSNDQIRQGVKEFSNWPTYPQLYVGGKLIGGNDIISELNEDGELADVLKA